VRESLIARSAAQRQALLAQLGSCKLIQLGAQALALYGLYKRLRGGQQPPVISGGLKADETPTLR
jgi:hypothetical protein